MLRGVDYLVASRRCLLFDKYRLDLKGGCRALTYVMRSFRSLPFFRPPNAIFVPATIVDQYCHVYEPAKRLTDIFLWILEVFKLSLCQSCITPSQVATLREVMEISGDISHARPAFYGVPASPHSNVLPCSCWRLCMKSPQPVRFSARKGREDWARFCCLRLRQGYGIAHIVSSKRSKLG